jgi:hypothetical protein
MGNMSGKTSRGSQVRLTIAGMLMVLCVGSSSATTVMWDGFDPNDPIGSAAGRINDLIRKNCMPGDSQIAIGMSAFERGSGGLSPDQLVHVTGAVHAAFSRTKNVQVAPFADIAGVLALQQAGLTNTTTASSHDIERELRRVQIVVQPVGAKVGQNFLLQLRAIGRQGIVCDVSTDAVSVPPHLTGERFETPDNLFQKVVRDVRDRSRGLTQIAMNARALNGDPLAPQIPGFFVFQMRQAITSTEATAEQVLGNPTRIEVFDARAAPPSPGTRWDADIAVQERATGYRIMIDLTRSEQSPIAYSGLVQPDALPAVRRPIGPGRALNDVTPLALRGVPVRVADLVDDRTPRRQYAFNLTTPSIVEIDVPVVNGKVVEMKPLVTDVAGRPQQNVNPRGERVNLRRFRLEPGGYTINIDNPGRTRHEFTLSARAASVNDMLLPEPPGRLTRQFEDWYVGEMLRGKQKYCYAFTAAKQVSPGGWREQTPVIWMGITDERQSPLSHYLDLADRYASDGELSATINGPDGGIALSIGPVGRHVNPVQPGKTGAPVLDRDAIRAYTRGGELELKGKSTDGRETRIAYSLSGYRSAASAMAMGCNRLDLARDLVWR